jgi:hypothetical protein
MFALRERRGHADAPTNEECDAEKARYMEESLAGTGLSRLQRALVQLLCDVRAERPIQYRTRGRHWDEARGFRDRGLIAAVWGVRWASLNAAGKRRYRQRFRALVCATRKKIWPWLIYYTAPRILVLRVAVEVPWEQPKTAEEETAGQARLNELVRKAAAQLEERQPGEKISVPFWNLHKCMAELRRALGNGPRPAAEIRKQLWASKHTVRQAKKRLCIQSVRISGRGGFWLWELPA